MLDLFIIIYTYKQNNSFKNQVCSLLISHIWQNKSIMLCAKQTNEFTKSMKAKTRRNIFTAVHLQKQL